MNSNLRARLFQLVVVLFVPMLLSPAAVAANNNTNNPGVYPVYCGNPNKVISEVQTTAGMPLFVQVDNKNVLAGGLVFAGVTSSGQYFPLPAKTFGFTFTLLNGNADFEGFTAVLYSDPSGNTHIQYITMPKLKFNGDTEKVQYDLVGNGIPVGSTIRYIGVYIQSDCGQVQGSFSNFMVNGAQLGKFLVPMTKVCPP